MDAIHRREEFADLCSGDDNAGQHPAGVDLNPKLLAYAMKIRTPKLIVMLITAFAIGGASIVFQSIINNTIVTPCLLGMNSLYTLIHTAVVFFLGSASVVASNANLSFAVDVVLMGIAATVIYSWIFKKTKHNVLYVLLVGTVLTSFFGSIQTTLTRVMAPNEYDSLLNTLVASFAQLLRTLIEEKKTTEREARKILARIAAQTGADIILSF